MSDERRDHSELPDDDRPPEPAEAAPETGESAGLGLTEEFARVEAEIEADLASGSSAAEPDQPSDEAAAKDAEPDHTDHAERGPDEEEPEPEEEAEQDPAEDAELEPTGEAEAEEEPPADGPLEVEGEQGSEGDGDSGDTPEAAGDEPTEDPDDGEADDATEKAAPVSGERDPATVVQASATRPIVRPKSQTAVPIGLGIPDEELDVKIPSLWLRFLSGSVLIVASMAAAVAVTGLLFFSDVAAKLQPIPGIDDQLAEVASDDPQTVMIIGSDRREGNAKGDKRSDTTMLLRVDPDKGVVSLFSLPRDLKVDIPGVGPSKLNEAYTIGGGELTLKTVKRFTGIDINHVVEINFEGFADAVNAIDCVFIDVDREYFNDNAGLPPELQYAEIDINAGYQRLCGEKALQYVRYRHEDTDLVRAARQQDFLREARQKVQPRELLPIFGQGNELIDIFTDYTRSDIADENDIIGILKSFIAVRDVPVNEVHFEGDIGGPTDTFVTSTDNQVERAMDEFLNGLGSEGRRGGENVDKKDNKKKDKKKKDNKKKDSKPEEDANVVSTEDLGDEKYGSMAARLREDAKKNVRRLGIPAFYPTVLVPGSSFSLDSRTYEIKAEDEKKEPAYKTVIALQDPNRLTEYYGFTGTTWSDPPILRNPSETRKIGGREYLLFYDGDRLRLVGWKEKGNAYWLNNTLPQSIGEAEMLAMAASIKEV